MDLSDPVTLAVLGGFLALSVYQWLRWRSRVAWFDRLRLERGADGDDPSERD